MSLTVSYCDRRCGRVAARHRARRLTICTFILVLLCVVTSRDAWATVADWTPPVTVGDWDNTIALTILNSYLYSVETSGALYRTDLRSGRWVQLGKPEFGNTRFLFSDNQSLFTIETDGSLYRVSPANGSWIRLGEAGAWRGTIGLVVLNGSLYSIESNGALYRTDLASARWVQVGKPEFANTSFMFADSQNLYTIETNGSLYRVSPTNGAWKMVGAAGAWKDTFLGTTLNGRIYTVERSGALYETDPASGVWKQIGKAEFGKSQFIFAATDSLYSIEAGDLYRINPLNGAWAQVGK